MLTSRAGAQVKPQQSDQSKLTMTVEGKTW